MKNYIKKELITYCIDPLKVSNLKEVSNKDGVIVTSLKYEETNYILKYFENDEHKREIANYNLLKSLNIRTKDTFSS